MLLVTVRLFCTVSKPKSIKAHTKSLQPGLRVGSGTAQPLP